MKYFWHKLNQSIVHNTSKKLITLITISENILKYILLVYNIGYGPSSFKIIYVCNDLFLN